MIKSRGTTDFWRSFHSLPAAVQVLARRNYGLWQAGPGHPSLHFKKITSPKWSVRVGAHYRAVGKFSGSEFVWEWIGTHEEYNKRY